jgi:protein-disulfide isomerase
MIVVGPESVLAAEAAECAADQGQFFPYHDLLFQNQGPENAGFVTGERLTEFAGQLRLDTNQFTECLTSHKYQELVAQGTGEARALGVRGTPTVFVNGRLAKNPLDLDEFRSIVLDELKRRP